MPDSKQPAHQRPDVVKIHQAIGGYITAFSEVVGSQLRGGLTCGGRGLIG